MSCVLPAPSSPSKAMIEPAFRSAPSSRPKDSVSAGLFEMNIATVRLRIADCPPRRVDFSPSKPADPGQRNLRELPAPLTFQLRPFARRHCEQQLVVFAVRD